MNSKQIHRELSTLPLTDPPETMNQRVKMTITGLKERSSREQRWWKETGVLVTACSLCLLIGFSSLLFFADQRDDSISNDFKLTPQQGRVFDVSDGKTNVFQLSGVKAAQVLPTKY